MVKTGSFRPTSVKNINKVKLPGVGKRVVKTSSWKKNVLKKINILIPHNWVRLLRMCSEENLSNMRHAFLQDIYQVMPPACSTWKLLQLKTQKLLRHVTGILFRHVAQKLLRHVKRNILAKYTVTQKLLRHVSQKLLQHVMQKLLWQVL